MLESRCCGWKTLRALDDLIRQGKVRYIGCSNWQAWRIATALGISACLNLARFNTLQAYYSIAGRDLERELVPLLEVEKLGLLVWSPLAGGLLSGRFSRESQWPAESRVAPSSISRSSTRSAPGTCWT
jgi:aryl-alcohol dehydrogenase-like predicted oxidoreductase